MTEAVAHCAACCPGVTAPTHPYLWIADVTDAGKPHRISGDVWLTPHARHSEWYNDLVWEVLQTYVRSHASSSDPATLSVVIVKLKCLY